MRTVTRCDQARETRQPFGVRIRRKLRGIELDPVDRRQMRRKQSGVDQGKARVGQILQGQAHLVAMRPGGCHERKAMPLAGLQRKSAPTLVPRNRHQLGMGQPFIQQHRLVFRHSPPVEWCFLDIARGRLLDILQSGKRISVGRPQALEIVQNGEITHTFEATGDGKSFDVNVEVPIDGSVWIAARTLGPPQHGAMDTYLFAHTNPVYVIADGEPIRSRSDAAFFVRWIDETLEDLRGMDRWDDPAHKEQVISTFEKGRQLYQAQIEELAQSRGAPEQ